MVSNSEISSRLLELAGLTALADGSTNSFRARAYQAAARAVEELAEPASQMSQTALTALRGIGKSTAAKIFELEGTGRIEKLEKLRREFPPDFVEMTRVPGLGPKKALLLRDRLGATSVDDLKRAIAAETLRDVPGLGPKTEQNLFRAIERLGIGGKERRTPIIDAMRLAHEITAALSEVEGVERAEHMGSLRRFRDTIGDLGVIVAASGEHQAVADRFVSLPLVEETVAFGARKSVVLVTSGMQVDLRIVEPAQFGAAALYFTGSKAHNIRLRQLAADCGWLLNEYGLMDAGTQGVIAAVTEEDVYAALGLDWISPEIREDWGEIEAAAAGALPELIQEDHLRGDLHVHTDWSGDGRGTLTATVAAAQERGYEYLAITDHAEDLAINGLSRERMLEQREALAGLEGSMMTVLHGAELNIGRKGTVDYDPGFLAGFGWGVASVHSLFDMPAAAQTERLITAMFDPAVNAIGHLSGRRIGRRPGIEFDVDAVLTAAAESRCAIEINCHLDRLDATAEVLRLARDRDVLFTIATDAHDARELANTRWGTRHARRGWVERDRVVNTWPKRRFLEWVEEKRGSKR